MPHTPMTRFSCWFFPLISNRTTHRHTHMMALMTIQQEGSGNSWKAEAKEVYGLTRNISRLEKRGKKRESTYDDLLERGENVVK